MVTAAPGMAAPLESAMVPRIDPSVPVCADAERENSRARATAVACTNFMATPPQELVEYTLMYKKGTVKPVADSRCTALVPRPRRPHGSEEVEVTSFVGLRHVVEK